MSTEPTASTAPVDWIRRAIGVVLIGGGVFGTIISVPIMFNGLAVMLFVIFYVLAIAGGIGLWRETRRGDALACSALAAQVPWIVASKFGYLFSCGIGLFAGFGSLGFSWRRSIGATFDFRLESGFGPQFENRPWLIGMNYFAAAALIYLIATAPRRFQRFHRAQNY